MPGIDVNTKLLLHFNGVDGSKEILDSGNTGHIVTQSVATLFKPNRFGVGGAAFAATGNDYLSIPDHADWDFDASQDFTIDFWVRFNTATRNQTPIGTTNPSGWIVYYHYGAGSIYKLKFQISGGVIEETSFIPVPNAWYHLAVVRSSNIIKIYVNGVGSTGVSYSSALSGSTNGLGIGKYSGEAEYFDGYMDEIRISKGVARWTANFDPPTDPFASDSNTKLLLHLNSSFADSGATGHTVTANGNAHIESVKFGKTMCSYNGTTAEVSIPDHADWDRAGAFTLELFVYFKALPGVGSLMKFFDNPITGNQRWTYGLYNNSGTYNLYHFYDFGVNQEIMRAWTPSINTWYHVAMVRTASGDHIRFFVDGTQVGADYDTALSYSSSTTGIRIGSGSGGTQGVNGYLDEVRWSNIDRSGGAATFNVPTAAYTSDANTKLLLHMDTQDDSQYQDKIPTFLGNTQLDTAQKEFGTASGLFDGTGDYITLPDHTDWNFPGNYTIDFWIRNNVVTDNSGVLIKGSHNTFNPWSIYTIGTALRFYSSSNGASWDIANGQNIIASMTAGVWYHVAVVRSGNNYFTFSNGTQTTTWTSSSTPVVNTLPLGIGLPSNGSGTAFNGWLDEIRISKGVARWTSNFTPPTAEYDVSLGAAVFDTINVSESSLAQGDIQGSVSDTIYVRDCKNFENIRIGGVDSYTKLLVHGNRVDGSSPKPITFFGTAQLDDTDKVFGEASLLLGGVSDYLSLPDSDDWYFGTGNFTVEFWLKLNATGIQQRIIGQQIDGNNFWIMRVTSANTLQMVFTTGGVSVGNYTTTSTITSGVWYHMAFVRAGSNGYIFVNGLPQPLSITTGFAANDVGNIGTSLLIGQTNGVNFLNGRLDELRISKGIARYEESFCPPTKTSHEDDKYTALLCHFDGVGGATATDDCAGGDNSGNHRIATYADNAQTDTAQSKFAGSSILFDGTGDYVSFPDNNEFSLGSNNFTIDCWARWAALPGVGTSDTFMGKWTVTGNQREYAFGLTNTAGAYFLFFNYSTDGAGGGSIVTSSSTDLTAVLTTNTWFHIAFVRDGNTGRFFVNGVARGTTNLTGATIFGGTSDLRIGALGSGDLFAGWMDEIRLSNGVARWTTAFTPPLYEYDETNIISQSDSVTVTDSVTGQMARTSSVFDLINITDTAAFSSNSDANIFEDINVLDEVTPHIPIIPVNIFDSVSVSDEEFDELFVQASLFDDILITDVETTYIRLDASLVDDISVEDILVHAHVVGTEQAHDHLFVSDDVTGFILVAASIFDTVIESDDDFTYLLLDAEVHDDIDFSDNTGFDIDEIVYSVGMNKVAYTGIVGNSFTGCTGVKKHKNRMWVRAERTAAGGCPFCGTYEYD